MNRKWKDQTALITGGGSGLGFAIANRLHALGVFIFLLDRDSEALQRSLKGLGERAEAVCLDVSTEEQVDAAVGSILENRGRIDILVNAAGITGATNRKSHAVELADFNGVLAVNLTGSFLTAKSVLPSMLERGYGRILHIASIAGKEGNAGMLAYSVSKAAVIGMTKVQGKEYAGSGVTVNALAPAVIQTPMVESMPAEQVKYMTDKIPMKRCGTLAEVAALAAFIVSPDCSFTTGFVFDLSGGRATY